MHISKTLYKEYRDSPKLAWWHVNDKDVYKRIMFEKYGDKDWAKAGQEVEDVVKDLFGDLVIVTVKTPGRDSDFYNTFAKNTEEALSAMPHVVYQPAFLFQDCFCVCDFLVQNDDGKYDLIEVKSKTTVRAKTGKHELNTDLKHDIGFQRYVLENSLGDFFSGECYLYHVDREYVLDGQNRT